MTSLLKWIRLTASLLLIPLLLLSCNDPEPAKIGFLGSLTGRASGLGTDGRNGFLLAIEQANSRGGINGRKVIPVVRDSRLDRQTALAATSDMIESGVSAIIGPMTSQIATTVVPDINRARIPMISPTVSTNQLVDQDDYFLRIYYTNAQAAEMLARQLAEKYGSTRVAAVYDLSNRAYTEDWLNIFRDRYESLGGKLVKAVSFEFNAETLFLDMADQVLASQPEAILILANAIDTALFCQQLSKKQSAVRLFATGWSYSDDLIQFGGQAVEGLTVIQSTAFENTRPNYTEFRRAFIERFHEPPNFPAVHSYDATRLVLQALSTTSNREEVRTSLLATVHQGLQGEIRFNRYGDCVNPPLFLAQIIESRFKPVDSE
jgi:branched-chain amino acid transport system substrate-binding protein